MSANRFLSLLCVLVAAIGLSSCGSSGSSNSNPISVSASASSSTVDGTDSVTVTASVTNDKNSAGVTWTVSGGGTLGGSTTTSTTYTAPAATASSQTITVTATSVADSTKSSSVTLTVPAAPSITTSTLAGATVGTAYSASLAASGGISPYTYAVSSGTLPAGLSLSSAGAITGTPTASGVGTANVTFKVTDSGKATALTATQQLSIAVTAAPAITFTTTTLAFGTTNAAYSASVSATGGAGALTYSLATGSSLPAGLSLSTAGAITGTPTAKGTSNFTVQAADAFGDSATQALTLTVYDALALPATQAGLPGTGNVSSAYSGTIVASGGSGSYGWQVTGLSDALTSDATGNTTSTLTISGTPTAQATVTFNVKLTDTVTNQSVTQSGYSITVGPSLVLALPASNPSTLPEAIINTAYTGTISASGGVAPFTWTISGFAVGSGGLNLGNGMTATASGNTLTVSGTPTATSTVTLTNVQITDSASATASGTYTIAVSNPPSPVSGSITLNNGCGGSTPASGITVTINTTPAQTTTTDANGNYSFASVLDGSYTITPSITGGNSLFLPATQNITVAGAAVAGENFNASIGYSVSGSVSYTGADSGPIYLNLVSSNCPSSSLGTSISSSAVKTGGAFTINGVPPGSYTLYATLDNLGQGARNETNPTANTAVTVSAANVTGVSITPADPTVTVPADSPTLKAISATDSGVAISYKPAIDSNGVEEAQYYTIQYATDQGFTTPTNVKMLAIGKGSDVWIINSNLSGVSLTNGTAYYFRARAETSAGAGPWILWSSGGVAQSVTIGAPTGFNTVAGAVTIPADITPTGPLYVGFYDQSSNNVYATAIPAASLSNSTPNTFSVSVPTGTTYIFFAILDQNNDGLVDAGDVTNILGNNNQTLVAISGALSNQNLTLPDVNSTAAVYTQYYNNTSWNGTAEVNTAGYNLSFNARQGNKLPIAVELTAASNPDVLTPVDLGNLCQNCGNVQFNYFAGIGSTVPNVGDTYTFKVTYSDGTSENVQGEVTGVIPGNIAPSSFYPIRSNPGDIYPTFNWYDWPATSAYTFYFQVTDNNGNVIWQIPSANSNSTGFSSAITTITWPTDPTDPTNAPTVTGLTTGDVYNWSVTTQDPNGNTAQTTWYLLP